MDCVGAVSGGNSVSFFAVNQDLRLDIFKSSPLPKRQCSINAIRYHPQQDSLLCAGTDGIQSVHSAIDNQVCEPLELPQCSPSAFSNISCAAVNESWIGYCMQNEMHVVSAENQAVIKPITTKKHSEIFNAVSFIANRYVIGGDRKGEILVHNCHSHLLCTSLNGYVSQSCINSIDITKHRINWFVACNDNGFNYLFDITRDKMMYYNYTHSATASQCAFNPVYSSLFASCGLDKKVLIHDINRKKVGIQFEAKEPLSCIQYLPQSEKYIVCTSTTGEIYLYDLRRFKQPLHQQSTSQCIIDIDLHPTLKWADVKSDTPESQKVEAIVPNVSRLEFESATPSEIYCLPAVGTQASHQDDINVKKQVSPIASAVASLPAYMNEKFGKLNISRMPSLDAHNLRDGKMTDLGITSEQDIVQADTKSSANCAIEPNVLERTIRKIVKEEVALSEERVLKEVGNMVHQLHSDLLEQFITNEMSAESQIQKVLSTMAEWKQSNDALQDLLKYAKF